MTEFVAPESTKNVTGWLEIMRVSFGNFLYPFSLEYIVKLWMGVDVVALADNVCVCVGWFTCNFEERWSVSGVCSSGIPRLCQSDPGKVGPFQGFSGHSACQ